MFQYTLKRMQLMKLKKIIIIALSTVVSGFGQSSKPKVMTQLDNIIPSGLRFCDLLDNFSSLVEFPGVSNDSSLSLKLKAGFNNNADDDKNYFEHPLTKYDYKSKKLPGLKPFLSMEKSFNNSTSGIYIGNFSTTSAKHNSLTTEDTVKTFKNAGIALNGAIWINPQNLSYIKGFSLWGCGDYDNRNTHFANIDDWKKLHTQYSYKRKYGQGLFTSTFSFLDNQYWILSFGYGKDIVSSEEKRLDTLFFSSNSYLSSIEFFDGSYDISYSSFEVGHIQKNKELSIGVFIGGDRTNIGFEKIDKDSSVFHTNGFFTKKIKFDRLLLYTGVDFKYSNTLYNNSSSRVGYLKLAKEYTVDRMSHKINFLIPLFGILTIGQKANIMVGIDLLYSWYKSNYDFCTSSKNEVKNSMFDFILYPLNLVYKPNSKMSISLSPKFEKEFFIGSLEITYEF